MNTRDSAFWIKVAAVATAVPRWVGALLAAEGFAIPTAWHGWWIVASAFLSAGMAVVEGIAFSYVFSAWRKETGSRAKWLFGFALLSGIVFTLVGAPYIAAQVRDMPIAQVLAPDWLWWAWSAAVFASTILILVSVGYAQRSDETEMQADNPALQAELEAAQEQLAQAQQELAAVPAWEHLSATGKARLIAEAGNGDRPPQKELAAALDVSASTVYRGYRRAEGEE